MVGVHRAPGAGGPSRGYLLTVALLAGTASMPILAAISAGSATPGSTALPDSSTPFMPTPSVGPVVIPMPMTSQPPLSPLGTPSVGPTSGWLPAAPSRPREGPAAADPGPARWTTAPPVAPRPPRSTSPPVPPPVAPPPPTDPDPTDPPDPDPTDPPDPDPTHSPGPDPTGSADPDPTPTLTVDPTPTLEPTPTPTDDATATAVPTITRSVPAPTPTPPAVPTRRPSPAIPSPSAVASRPSVSPAPGRTDVPRGVADGTVTIRRGLSGDGGARR
ncbi:hypothetical protein PSH03_001620 [Micromonospora sp. PSH03]|uniref:hypothetical protein n=1 Tax=Micromonospora salmantinae TaxID=2911211 RepID=UPI001EE9A6C8|nr:hypothetical protein [Micromonospora salmantinae]MCG5456717.1 hypothetical protein [Micromonospora salmantinae]